MPTDQLEFENCPQLPERRSKARAKAREADWRRQLAPAFVYQSARSPEDVEELLSEYERREAEGPDFMRIRPQSVTRGNPWDQATRF